MASDRGEVSRLEPWQLPIYLDRLDQAGTAEVRWNKETLSLAAARERAGQIDEMATVVVDGTNIYVAVPDHSADDAPRINPLQVRPLRPRP